MRVWATVGRSLLIYQLLLLGYFKESPTFYRLLNWHGCKNASINLRHFRCDDDLVGDDSPTTIICEVCPCYVRASCVMFKVEGVERLSFCLGARNDGQAFTEEIFVTAAWDTTSTADDERSEAVAAKVALRERGEVRSELKRRFAVVPTTTTFTTTLACLSSMIFCNKFY